MYAHMTAESRMRAVGFLEAGLSKREIAARLGVGRSTIQRISRKWETEHSVERTPGSARPRISTAEEDEALVTFIRENPFKTSPEAKQETNFPGTARTARRRLKAADLKAYTALLKPFLTEENKRARLTFAETYVNEPMRFWEKVIFSDEKTFQSCHNGSQKVYRPKNERFNPRYIKENFSSGKFSVNVWGWVNFQTVGFCYDVNERLTSDGYIQILENIMLPSVTQIYPANDFVFQQVSPFD